VELVLERAAAQIDKDIEVLKRLGLSQTQAKIYITLSKTGESKAKTISAITEVARQDVYETIPTLEKMGLIERIHPEPFKFRAIPMEKAVAILINLRKQETHELNKKAKNLVKKYSKVVFEEPEKEEDALFILAAGQRFNPAFYTPEHIRSAKKSVECATKSERAAFFISHHKQTFKKASDRGVKIRYVVEKTKENSVTSVLEDAAKKTSVELRFTDHVVPTPVLVMDEKSAYIVISPKSSISEKYALLSNNDSILKLLKSYFEALWTTSSDSNSPE
jgi:sugar-specific transcriptional regulator TrmB